MSVVGVNLRVLKFNKQVCVLVSCSMLGAGFYRTVAKASTQVTEYFKIAIIMTQRYLSDSAETPPKVTMDPKGQGLGYFT